MHSTETLKALIVEDEPITQIIIKANLASAGIESVVVDNGVKAIEKLRDQSFNFILMDVCMPDQDGLDATRWIRESPDRAVRDLPIFAITSYSSIEHTEEILNSGMNEHLVKPFRMETLLPILRRYF
jgi:CheY-like chemotaxis protein